LGVGGRKRNKSKSKSKSKRKSKRESKRESINNKNTKARGPKSTGFNKTNKHKELISKLQGRQ
jgi:hypothetical protein